ncbi:MAG: hypothetical protein AB4057_11230 [Crocosphaera sp.]
MKQNFYEISLKQLRQYVLSHREDEKAFHIYVDRVNSEQERTTYPPLKSLEDMEKYPDVLNKLRQEATRNVNPNS